MNGDYLDADAWLATTAFDSLQTLHLHLDDPPSDELERLLRSAKVQRIPSASVFAWDGHMWSEPAVAAFGLPYVTYAQAQMSWSWLEDSEP